MVFGQEAVNTACTRGMSTFSLDADANELEGASKTQYSYLASAKIHPIPVYMSVYVTKPTPAQPLGDHLEVSEIAGYGQKAYACM